MTPRFSISNIFNCISLVQLHSRKVTTPDNTVTTRNNTEQPRMQTVTNTGGAALRPAGAGAVPNTIHDLCDAIVKVDDPIKVDDDPIKVDGIKKKLAQTAGNNCFAVLPVERVDEDSDDGDDGDDDPIKVDDDDDDVDDGRLTWKKAEALHNQQKTIKAIEANDVVPFREENHDDAQKECSDILIKMKEMIAALRNPMAGAGTAQQKHHERLISFMVCAETFLNEFEAKKATVIECAVDTLLERYESDPTHAPIDRRGNELVKELWEVEARNTVRKMTRSMRSIELVVKKAFADAKQFKKDLEALKRKTPGVDAARARKKLFKNKMDLLTTTTAKAVNALARAMETGFPKILNIWLKMKSGITSCSNKTCRFKHSDISLQEHNARPDFLCCRGDPKNSCLAQNKPKSKTGGAAKSRPVPAGYSCNICQGDHWIHDCPDFIPAGGAKKAGAKKATAKQREQREKTEERKNPHYWNTPKWQQWNEKYGR